jgi:capsular polysaccharide biosynthesis protein
MEQVMQLDNRANSLRLQYQEISAKLLSAQNSARMAQEQKGERLSVIEPPEVPDTPISPNRPLLIVGGIAVGLALGLLLALILEFVLRPIRGVDQISRLGLDPLAVVPTFTPDRPRRVRRPLASARAGGPQLAES